MGMQKCCEAMQGLTDKSRINQSATIKSYPREGPIAVKCSSTGQSTDERLRLVAVFGYLDCLKEGP